MTYDIAIIGAGPSGSCAATFLAQAGLKVVVLEKETFPRFHIGESLLPIGVPILQLMGVNLDQEPYAIRKAGAQVIYEPTQQSYHIDFAMTLKGCFTYAYQVERATFDHHLTRRAEHYGATIHFNTKVTDTREDNEGVEVLMGEQSLRARYLIDASGMNCFSARRGNYIQRIMGMGKCATFSQFGNVTSQKAKEIFQKGDILLFLLERGWGWAIPLSGHRVSTGTIHIEGQKVPPPEEAFNNFLSGSPLMQELLVGAERLEPIRRCSDFSYYNLAPTTKRQTVLGDARIFLDPVFSSGVSFGLYAGQRLAETMIPLIRKDASLAEGLSQYQNQTERGYQVIERVIERFYRPSWAHNTFFAPNKTDDMVQQLNSILAGDVWRDDNAWQQKLLAARRRTLRFEKRANIEAS